MNVKNQQLLWDLYAGIARDVNKTSGYYGNYMRVLQGMLKKPNEYQC
jgi:RNA binding exosome subunit